MKQPFERASASKRHIILNNFIGGIAWGLGVTIGLSIVLALLGLLSNAVGLVPFVGDFVSQVIDYIQTNNPRLR